ncbi:hypothetical protein EON65_12855 [archaeon]|nr:MAG: hypothetical protein EON65_12855 [archaeon]
MAMNLGKRSRRIVFSDDDSDGEQVETAVIPQSASKRRVCDDEELATTSHTNLPLVTPSTKKPLGGNQ